MVARYLLAKTHVMQHVTAWYNCIVTIVISVTLTESKHEVRRGVAERSLRHT